MRKLDIYGDSMHKICKQEKENIAYILAGRYKVMKYYLVPVEMHENTKVILS